MKRLGSVVVLGLGGLLVSCSGGEEPMSEAEVQQALHRRCASPQFSEQQVADLEAKAIAKFGPEDEVARPPKQSVEILTYVHVINGGTEVASGNISDQMVADQIKVLNEAYKDT